MKRKVTLTVDLDTLRDFKKIGGNMSNFVEEKMAEHNRLIRVQGWITCIHCKEKSHIRVILNNDGLCPKDACKQRIIDPILPI